jgi:hypothetical protein
MYRTDMTNKVKKVFRRFDKRILWIFLATVAVDVVSILIYFYGPPHDPAHFFGAFFVAWSAGAAYFTIVGSVASFASLERPEKGSFDSRARILFQHASGLHIDFLIEKMKSTFDQYAEFVDIDIKLVDYDESDGKYRFDQTNHTIIKSYIEDVPCNFTSEIGIANVAAPPIGKSPNRLISLKVNNVSYGAGELFQNNSLSKHINSVIEKTKACDICHRLEYWVQQETENNNYTPKRYTQKIVARVENNLVPGVVVVLRKMNLKDGGYDDIEVFPGQHHIVVDEHDAHPFKKVMEFQVLPPRPI